MAPTRQSKGTKSQADLERDINLDRDMREITRRLQSIEGSIQNIDAREQVQVQMQFTVAALERRIEGLEKAKANVVNIVMGSVGVALLALVVGPRLS